MAVCLPAASGLSMLSLLVAELAQSFGKRGATPKVLATSATVSISKLNVDAELDVFMVADMFSAVAVVT